MTSVKAIAICRILCIGFSLVFAFGGQAGPLVKVRFGFSTTESHPYQMGNGSEISAPPGIAVELIRAVCTGLDIEPEFLRFPNKRVLLALEGGKQIDAAFIFSHSPDREKFAIYPRLNDGTIDSDRQIATLSYYFYVKDPKITWDGTTLAGAAGSVGANTGFSIVEKLKQLGLTVSEEALTRQIFRMLDKGRVIAYAGQSTISDAYIKTNPEFAGIKRLEPTIASKPYFVVFSHEFYKTNKDITVKFWNRLKEIRDDQTQLLLKKYL